MKITFLGTAAANAYPEAFCKCDHCEQARILGGPSLRKMRPFRVGHYRVTAFPANHALTMGALLYAIESNGRSIFYGTDTAALLEQTWQAFHEHQLRFDVVILDHTYGPDEPAGNDHLSAHQVIEHVARMRDEGLLTAKARAFATHIAHQGNPAHPQLAEFAKQNGYEIAYDGLVLEI